MTHPETMAGASGPGPNQARRTVLGALLSASTAALIPWALAEPVADAGSGAFLALSALIAGRQSLDGVQARRLYVALCADDAGFAAGAQALLALVNARKLDASTLQRVLDDDKSTLAAIPRKIATAWFAGTVGTGAKARCLAYETALNAQIVADVLKPPSYAYGAYGSWTRQPL